MDTSLSSRDRILEENNNEQVKVEKLKIFPWQRVWYRKIQKILDEHYCYVDNSPTGVGKTFMSLYVAIKRNLPVVVIGPATLEEDWREYALNYGVKLIDYISYHSLAGKTGKIIKHGLLTREDKNKNVIGKNSTTVYDPTDYLIKLIDDGTFFIFDEIQNAKNESTFFKSVVAISSTIRLNIYPGCKTIAAFMSATPIVKQSEAIRLLKVMGVITKEKLYHINQLTKRPVFEGFREVVNFAKKYNMEKTNKLVDNSHKSTNDEIKELTWKIYVQVLKPNMVGAMVAPASAFPDGALLDAKNGFYNISQNGGDKMAYAIQLLGDFVSFEQKEDEDYIDIDVFREKGRLAQLQIILHELEKPRIEIYARLASLYLNENLNRKVIIFVNYDDTVVSLKWVLQNFNPVIMTGKTPIKKRKEIKDRFNTDLNCRLMIANFKVGGVGLSLHDKVGDSPRVVLLTPNYYLINLHQAAGRVYRMGLKSLATVRMVYAKGTGLIENRILDNIAKKTDILKQAIDEASADCTLFPGDYPYYIEPKVNNVMLGEI